MSGLHGSVLVVFPLERAPDASHGEDARIVSQMRDRFPALGDDEETLGQVQWGWEEHGCRRRRGGGGRGSRDRLRHGA